MPPRGLNLQTLIILVVIGLSFLSWAIGRLNEARQRRQFLEQQRRRREDELRTGRPSEEPKPVEAPTRDLSELAARRQEQLRQLRLRQQQQTQGGGVVAVPPPRPAGVGAPRTFPARTPPTAQPPIISRPASAPPARPQAPARPASAPAVRRPPAGAPRPAPESRPAGRPVERPVAPPTPRPPERPQTVSAPAYVEHRVGAAASGPAMIRALLRESADHAASRQRLAALIAAGEVLAPPIASRSEEQLPWNRGL